MDVRTIIPIRPKPRWLDFPVSVVDQRGRKGAPNGFRERTWELAAQDVSTARETEVEDEMFHLW